MAVSAITVHIVLHDIKVVEHKTAFLELAVCRSIHSDFVFTQVRISILAIEAKGRAPGHAADDIKGILAPDDPRVLDDLENAEVDASVPEAQLF